MGHRNIDQDLSRYERQTPSPLPCPPKLNGAKTMWCRDENSNKNLLLGGVPNFSSTLDTLYVSNN